MRFIFEIFCLVKLNSLKVHNVLIVSLIAFASQDYILCGLLFENHQLIFFIKMQKHQNQQCLPTVILIYYNFKGIGQIIRLLLSYIQISYTDIYLDEYQTQKLQLPLKVRKILEEHPVSRADLPAIIHEGKVVYELNLIITYICRAFDREDMLGIDIQQKSHICQFMQIYSNKLVPNHRFLMSYMEEVLNPYLEGINLLLYVEVKYAQYLESAGYLMELTTHFLKNGGEDNFVFGNFTVMDCYFIQGVRQSLAFFGCIDQQVGDKRWEEATSKYRLWKQSKGDSIYKTEILRAMKKFEHFFTTRQFYIKKQEYFEGFRIVPKHAPESSIDGMKKIWGIDIKYFKY